MRLSRFGAQLRAMASLNLLVTDLGWRLGNVATADCSDVTTGATSGICLGPQSTQIHYDRRAL